MTQPELHVTGIGNAIVDVIAHADEDFLAAQGLTKGSMMLIDDVRAHALYAQMGPGKESSGGSAANTMAGLASLGGRGAYIGKVGRDQLGEVFTHDIRATGLHFATAPVTDGTPTARCLILVTADAQRTMNTFLGACVDLGPEDIDEALIQRSQVTYLEGYLFDKPRAKSAFRRAAEVARGAGRKVALSLSDSFCVDRHRGEFLQLIEEHVDILFANEGELLALFQSSGLEAALAALKGRVEVAAITHGAAGSYVFAEGDVVHVAAEPVSRLVDTTGAGDLYAAGFLYGYTQGRRPAECGRIGAIAAAEVIGHYGARPETELAALVRARLG
jgi:sugar/nucleoside kinase (ribokinase family)